MSLFYDESLCLYFVECQRCSVHNFVTSSDQEGCTLGKIWGLRILSELLLYSFFGKMWLIKMFHAANKKGKEYNMVFIQALEKNNFQQKLNFFL